MAETSNYARFLNPWVLHLQKLGLELKCPLCLNLLNRPMLLPCSHIICNSCMPTSTQFGSECPVCKQQYADRDIRSAPFMENMVAIYRSLDATFSANLLQSVSDAGRVSEQTPVMATTNIDNDLSKESVETTLEGNSSNGQSVYVSTANKQVKASVNQSTEGVIKLNGKSRSPRIGQMEVTEMCCTDRVHLHSECKLFPPHSPGCMRAVKHEELGTEEIDMKIGRSLSVSPSSFGDTKDMDNRSAPVSINDDKQRLQTKRLVMNNSDGAAGEMNDTPSKKQKIADCALLGMDDKSNGQRQLAILQSESATVSKFEDEVTASLSNAWKNTIPESSDANKCICAFCQSFRITDRTGPMLHYANGKEVKGDIATHPNVIHVHQSCLEWTPQAYFIGETVKNLEVEVARAAKLKCSSCGIKGAALGCTVKHCRKSYHVPCAVALACRWDCEEFLMLCPIHSSAKFPSEKSKSRKNAREKEHLVSTRISLKQSDFWVASPNGAKEWLLCGSALSAEEKYLLVKFASICGATVSKFWKPNVTHVIAATDAAGACSRTLKVLMAILNGKWILTIDWIKACMKAMHPVDEEPYEVSLDNHGCFDGPKTGRLRALTSAPKLFNGLNFYLYGDFLQAYKEDLLGLVISAGGNVIESMEQLMARSYDVQTSSSTLVVYNVDPPQEFQSGNEAAIAIAMQRLEEAESLADEIGCGVVGHTWLLESIAACKLRPFAC